MDMADFRLQLSTVLYSHQIDVEGTANCSGHNAVCPLAQCSKWNVVATESYRSERTEKLAGRSHAFLSYNMQLHVGTYMVSIFRF